MGVYLHTNFQVSSIILTNFRRGNFTPPHAHTPQSEPLKCPPRLELSEDIMKNLLRITLILFKESMS